jgi:hypothetical protein
LAEDERHSLPELILTGDGILKEGSLHGRQIVILHAGRVEQRLVGQIGGIERELCLQPSRKTLFLHLSDGSPRGSPGGLIEKSGGGAIRYLRIGSADKSK